MMIRIQSAVGIGINCATEIESGIEEVEIRR
jgi:hypothetical protein